MSARSIAKLLPVLGFLGCVGQIGEAGTGPGTGTTGSGGTTPALDAGREAAAPDPGGSGGAGSGTGGGALGSGGAGSGTGGAVTGSGGATSGTGGATVVADGLPCDVQTVVSTMCSSCHGTPPMAGVPSLVSYASLTAASTRDPAQTNAQRALARMQDNTTPMPPSPGTRASAAQVTTLQSWISAGYPKGSCGGGADGGAGGTSGGADGGTTDAVTVPDPFAVPPTCTSGKMWTGGNNGSANMYPGVACINCHTSSGGEAPRFAIAGTVYPTAHEPDSCNGLNGSAGVTVQITTATGQQITLTPNSVGNFSYNGTVALPYQAKVVGMGRERIMLTAQQSGDCNACHTQQGAMSAPGRILAP